MLRLSLIETKTLDLVSYTGQVAGGGYLVLVKHMLRPDLKLTSGSLTGSLTYKMLALNLGLAYVKYILGVGSSLEEESSFPYYLRRGGKGSRLRYVRLVYTKH